MAHLPRRIESGPGAGDVQQGASYMTIGSYAVLDGSSLLRIERPEI
jgi:hypothetical protein